MNKKDHYSVKKHGRPLRPLKHLMKAKSSSLHKNPITLTVLSSNVAAAYAYIKPIAAVCGLLALASSVARGCSGQDSDVCSANELRYGASKTILTALLF